MARLYQNVELKRTSRGSVVRLAVFAFVALFIVIGASSVLSTPFLQIYWGAAGRLKSSGVATGTIDMAEIAGGKSIFLIPLNYHSHLFLPLLAY